MDIFWNHPLIILRFSPGEQLIFTGGQNNLNWTSYQDFALDVKTRRAKSSWPGAQPLIKPLLAKKFSSLHLVTVACYRYIVSQSLGSCQKHNTKTLTQNNASLPLTEIYYFHNILNTYNVMMRWKVKGVVLTQQLIVFIVLVFFNIISSIVIVLLHLNVNKLNIN